MIDTLSKERIMPSTNNHPTADISMAFANENFLKLRAEYIEDDTTISYKGGWLENDHESLGEHITPCLVQHYEDALLGKMTNELHTNRRDLLLYTNRFHHVTQKDIDGICVSICSCRRYWLHKWCYASWYIQHQVSLVHDGQKIPSKRRGTKKPTESQKVAHAIQNKEKRKKARTIFDNRFDDNNPEGARILTPDDFASKIE
jgi:hypothetical protein